ncbi:type II secretion system F family protein [Nitriliruptor alkaliphilus]|uniref:type II secretion system F family protein n=1 Tax=Nitriliruptor alkaliphilus TaxID=427918 RepID=UPI00069919AC|nr:type II secretion system F family protein [Nitriliruptor alkaliphilus]
MSRDPAPHGRELDRVRLRVAAGADPGDVAMLGERTATVVRVATEAGSPLLAALDAAADAEDDARRAQRAVAVASAQGRAVAIGLLVAPLLLVPFLGRLFGIDLVAYHRTPIGMVTGGLGLSLLLVGGLAARRVVAAVGAPARPPSAVGRRLLATVGASVAAVAIHPVAGLVLFGVALLRGRPRPAPPDPAVADAAELAATAVGGGLPPAAALRLAADELPALAAPLRRLAFDLEHGDTSADLPPGVDRLADVLTDADRLGAPVGPTLRRLAADVRADELTRVLAAAERLPVRLTFPTALCLLPGTLLLVGAPIVQVGLGVVST